MAKSADQQDALFVNLVLIFQNAAMQQMGKITNPMTGKVERNLDQARFSIDMIDMLRSKTRGNLSSDLETLLDSTLTNLRMNYVEETSKGAGEESGAKKEEERHREGESKDTARPEGGDKAVGDEEADTKQGTAPAEEAAAGSGEGSGSGEKTEGKDASEF